MTLSRLIDPDYLAQLLQQQRGLCAICGEAESQIDPRTKRPKPLAIDHDHKTGRIRGLLCHRCNVGLGYFRDDPNLLDLAAGYLFDHDLAIEEDPTHGIRFNAAHRRKPAAPPKPRLAPEPKPPKEPEPEPERPRHGHILAWTAGCRCDECCQAQERYHTQQVALRARRQATAAIRNLRNNPALAAKIQAHTRPQTHKAS